MLRFRVYASIETVGRTTMGDDSSMITKTVVYYLARGQASYGLDAYIPIVSSRVLVVVTMSFASASVAGPATNHTRDFQP